jgi:hypothetical protein
LSFAVADIGGIVGAVMVMQLFERMRSSDTAGTGSVFLMLTSVDETVGAVLVVATIIGAAGVLVCVVRMFKVNNTASPPGILYIVPALTGLGAPVIIAYISWMIISALTWPRDLDQLGREGTQVGQLYLVALFLGIFSIADALAVALIPFRARLGRKISPVIFSLLLTIATAALGATVFWMAFVAHTHVNDELYH